MSDQTTLIMPCLPCEPPCPWPPPPSTGVGLLMTGLVPNLCPDCLSLNLPYGLDFLEKTLTPFSVSCTYLRDFFPGFCTFTELRLVVTQPIGGGDITCQLRMFSPSTFQVLGWARLLVGPETTSNGPFSMSPSVGSIFCNATLSFPTIVGI